MSTEVDGWRTRIRIAHLWHLQTLTTTAGNNHLQQKPIAIDKTEMY